MDKDSHFNSSRTINNNGIQDSSLNPSSHYYIHHSDGPSSLGVAPTLDGANYHFWSLSMRRALIVKNKFKFVDGSIEIPPESDPSYEAWQRCNALVHLWIMNSVTPTIAKSIVFHENAIDVWKDLRERFYRGDSLSIYELNQEIYTMKQGELTVTEFFGELMVRWGELESYRPIPRYEDCVVRFVIGLNDEFSVVKSHVLMMDPLPTLNKVFSMVLQQERLGRFSGGGDNDSKILRSGVDAPPSPQGRERCQNEENVERLKKEQEEKEHKKKEKAEAHLYTIIKVARDEDLTVQIGKDIYFDLVDHDKVWSFRVQKQMPFNVFKEEVAKEFDIPVQFQRFWLWAKRKNHTYRPFRPLTHIEEAQSIGQLRGVSNKVHNAELKLFLEVEKGMDSRPIAPPDKTKDDILLFFKLYDPEKEELRYVGRLSVKCTGMPSEILTRLNEMAGYDPEEDIALYEEIKFEPHLMCEPIDKKVTFLASQLENGDIVCFQKAPSMDSEEHVRYPDVPSYLEYVLKVCNSN